MPALPPPHPAAPPRIRRWRVRLAFVGLLAIIVMAHAPILRGLARALIVDDPASAADWLFVDEADYSFDRAAELYRAGTASGILVADWPTTRLVRIGLKPSRKDLCLRELGRRGVSPGDVTALPVTDRTPWQIAHALDAWLGEHRAAHVVVLCERFSSADLQFVVSKVMRPEEARRVSFRGLPDHRYDETNWWRNRAGVRAFTGAAFDLAYDALHGEDAPTVSVFNPDAFERSLLNPDRLVGGAAEQPQLEAPH